jgi:hypothetical protein
MATSTPSSCGIQLLLAVLLGVCLMQCDGGQQVQQQLLLLLLLLLPWWQQVTEVAVADVF